MEKEEATDGDIGNLNWKQNNIKKNIDRNKYINMWKDGHRETAVIVIRKKRFRCSGL